MPTKPIKDIDLQADALLMINLLSEVIDGYILFSRPETKSQLIFIKSYLTCHVEPFFANAESQSFGESLSPKQALEEVIFITEKLDSSINKELLKKAFKVL